MSTIRKAYMEISNGIRGLRFHRDTPSTSSTDSGSSNSSGSGGGTSNGAVGNTAPTSSTTSKASVASDDSGKSPSSVTSVRTSKSVVHSEESAVAHAMSRLFPNKNSHSSSSSSASSTSSSSSTMSSFSSSTKTEQTRSSSTKSSLTPNNSTNSSTPRSPSHSSTKSSLLSSSSSSSSYHSAPSSSPPSSSSVSSSSVQASINKLTANGDAGRCHNGRTLSPAPAASRTLSPASTSTTIRRTSKENVFTQTKLVGSPKAGIASRIRKLNLSMTGQKWCAKPETMAELMDDEVFIQRFFYYFSANERRVLCIVCRKWRALLYENPVYWVGAEPVIDFKHWGGDPAKRKLCFDHFQQRGFDQVAFISATDRDLNDFVGCTPGARRTLRAVSISCSNITDSGLENLLRKAPAISRLGLSNCNEVTGSGLWACLNPKIQVLTITDCIHIADDTLGAIAQLLPHLHELTLQAYHVTDNGLALFDAKLNSSIRILRLVSCWEVTNHGVVNIIHALPNLTVLSLSGCSKLTDDGVEIIAENMKRLKSLDLSWCARVTDAALECIACDLGSLDELVLDRCTHVTDIGIGYISTMTSLTRLFIRWCIQVGDFGLHHIFSMRNLRVLSIAGCRRLTSNGLYGLRHLQRLHELEVTNCPAANSAVCRYLKDNMPNTLLLE